MRTPVKESTDFLQWLLGTSNRKREAPAEEPEGSSTGGAAVAPASKRQKTTTTNHDEKEFSMIKPKDVLVVIHSTDRSIVTMYMDLKKKKRPKKPDSLMAEVQAFGGRFVLLENDGTRRILTDNTEITDLITKAHHKPIMDGDAQPSTPQQAGSGFMTPPRATKAERSPATTQRQENLNEHAKQSSSLSPSPSSYSSKRKVYDESNTTPADENEDATHPALDLSEKALAATAPIMVKKTDTQDYGGTTFGPDVSCDMVQEFIEKAKAMSKTKSEDSLYSLLPDLDDEEDAVHLYRNFHDEPAIRSEMEGRSEVFMFSRREVDIIVYSALTEIEYDYTWQLMPYRNRKELFELLRSLDVHELQKNKSSGYIHHLNTKTSILFNEE